MTNETVKILGQDKETKTSYSKPQLIYYGRVEEITKGGSGSNGEVSSFFSGL
jgi:hypothetical protein